MCIYLASYFNTLPDYHKNTFTKSDDDNYIKEYYKSIQKNKLNCIIFYDNLSISFIQKYPYVK